MWIKLKNRGDPRTIYLVVILLVGMGAYWMFNNAVNSADNIQKQTILINEINKIDFFDNNVKLNKREIQKHIIGNIKIIDTLYYVKDKEKFDSQILFNNIVYQGWTKENNNIFKKNNLTMKIYFLNNEEYSFISHMNDKVVWKIEMEIDDE